MTQAWTKQGKRVAVTRVVVKPNVIVSEQVQPSLKAKMFEIGYGDKKLKNMTKPLRTKLSKSGFSFGVLQLKGRVDLDENSEVKIGSTIAASDVLEVGDLVDVRGITKGRGFSGAMKRHGFHGVGGRTHGQSDRSRAVGAIGAGTDPGRVIPGKKMPGQYGNDTKTVEGLTVLYIDQSTGEVWLSGPVPGAITSTIEITKVGQKKEIELDKKASGIKEEVVAEVTAPAALEEVAEVEVEVKETEATPEVAEEK